MPRATRQEMEKPQSNQTASQDEQRADDAAVDQDAQLAPVDPMLTEDDNGFDATVSDDERRRMIAEAAYYIAQRRGFTDGYELDDWLLAEVEVNKRVRRSPPF